jgi:hypothetical protein
VLAALRRSAPALALLAVATLIGCLVGLSARPDVYEASASVDVTAIAPEAYESSSSADEAERLLTNESFAARSRAVTGAAAERVGLAPEDFAEDVEVAAVTGADVLAFTARADDPDVAAANATAYAATYAESRVTQRRDALLREADLAAEQVQLLRAQVVGLDDAEAEALLVRVAEAAQREIDFRVEANSLDPARAVTAASVPRSPAGLSPVVWAVAAALLVLVLGAGAVLLRERAQDRVLGADDLRRTGAPVFASTPGRAGRRHTRQGELDSIAQTAAAMIQLLTPAPRVIAVLAAGPEDAGVAAARALTAALSRSGSAARLVEPGHLAPPEARPEDGHGPMVVSCAPIGLDARARFSVAAADLVVLVAVSERTAAAEVDATLGVLDQVSAAPRAWLLLGRRRDQRRSLQDPAGRPAPPEVVTPVRSSAPTVGPSPWTGPTARSTPSEAPTGRHAEVRALRTDAE